MKIVYEALCGFIFQHKQGAKTMKSKVISFLATALACAIGVYAYNKYMNKTNAQ